MTNKDLVDMIFDGLKKLGYKPYKITHPDGYFICDMGKDSVTHFRLKGHGMWRHWLFGLWVHEEYMTDEEVEKLKKKHEDGNYDMDPKAVSLFAQYDTQIDKFKPSRSSLCFEMDAEDVLDEREFRYNELESMLGMMCKHPFMCYSEFCGNYAGYFSKSFIWRYISWETEKKWEAFIKAIKTAWWLPWTKLKVALCKNDKCLDNIELYDFKKNNPGWSTDYLYQVRIRFTEAATEDEELAFLNKWWHKDHYGKIGYYDFVVELDSFTKVGKDEWYTYANEND